MPSLKDFNPFPPGAAPRTAKMWGLLSFMLIVLIIFWAFGSPAAAPGTKTAAKTAPAGSAVREDAARTAQQYEAQLKREMVQLAEMDRALAATKQNAQAAAKQAEAGFFPGQRDPDPYTQPAPAPPVDPIEQERIRLKLEMFKRTELAAFAAPEALSLRDAYPQQQRSPDARKEAQQADAPAAADKASGSEPAASVAAPEPGRKHIVREGTFLSTTLINRLDSTFSGPVLVQVATDLWARDRQTLLIPKGAKIIGEAKAVTATGQARVAVVFHRLVRQDDVTVNLDKFTGLNQTGETGLKDKVNNHYLQIFGTSIALGVIGAAAQGSASYGFGYGGWDAARGGFGQGMSRAAEQVLAKYLNIPPTVTIREGHRINVFFMTDLEVPPYRRED